MNARLVSKAPPPQVQIDPYRLPRLPTVHPALLTVLVWCATYLLCCGVLVSTAVLL